MNPNLTPRPWLGPHHMPATTRTGHGEAHPGAAAGGRAAWLRLPELLPLLGPGLSTPRDNHRPESWASLLSYTQETTSSLQKASIITNEKRQRRRTGKQWVFPRTQADAQGHPRRRRSRASGRDSGRVLGSAGQQDHKSLPKTIWTEHRTCFNHPFSPRWQGPPHKTPFSLDPHPQLK